MLRACACAAVVLLSASAVFADESFSLNQLKVGQKFDIYTQDCQYRGELVNRQTGECRMQVSDGKRFSEARTVFVVGATQGVQDQLTLLRMREVKVGMKVELGLDDLQDNNRAHTTQVTRFTIFPAP